jgi:acyl-CoA thioester hydrolase
VTEDADERPGEDGAAELSIVEPVRFADLDALGHVNNVTFVRWFETARIEWMRALFPGSMPTDRETFGFILGDQHISYRAPAFYPERIRVTVRPGRLSRSTLRVDFEMRSEEDGRLIADGYGTLVAYDWETERSAPLPDDLRARLAPAA